MSSGRPFMVRSGPRKKAAAPLSYSMVVRGKPVRSKVVTAETKIEPIHSVRIRVIRRGEEVCAIFDGNVEYRKRVCRTCGKDFLIARFPTRSGRPKHPDQRPAVFEGMPVARYQNSVNCPDCIDRRNQKYTGPHLCAICGEEIPRGTKRRDARFCDLCDTPAKRQAFYRQRKKG